ncbi:uncharacterized protein DUF3142|uniref:Uncharacterized protein DUF3142 n=1 Tax=Brenneria salicis ATCC 15712 = DSM 30166 TaxID=714314 RepID=A0A366I651_9GAMM|nr:DUF3142 domain-containing protein [Brenneria salicis]NMN93225.1 uncharacterized protein DUF3142 [Brenneria salicis ATCC 15712 = DSM 30166]RBP64086.1 uncharacterized protein DUF3142 [Brenneria salicis ATCC 15712 = DSM 30166]RLM31116.1 hypothetical protein BHG07_07050 [Brenneria salicis ATCC 15712 = DSM 30166]
MGRPAQILLVTQALMLAWALAFSAQAATVDASRYQAFWLWVAVRPQPVLHQAQTLYLHQGEIARRQGKLVFLRQGLPPSKLRVATIWLSYRMTTLDLSDRHLNRMLKLRENWRSHGNQVKGIQIDFDAKSYQLAGYVAFLQQLRKRLPADCQISITGLLDWSKTGDVAQLNRLHESVDELVVQTYQGRNTVTNYVDYLPALLKLKLPFRLGLVQHGKWNRQWQQRLARSPYYRGEVVFLINPP